MLLTTRAGLAGIDEALQPLSDEELDALVERARRRGRDLRDATVAAVIREVLKWDPPKAEANLQGRG